MHDFKINDKVRTTKYVTGYPEVDTGTTGTVTRLGNVLLMTTSSGVDIPVYRSEIELVDAPIKFVAGDKVVTSGAPVSLRTVLRDLNFKVNADGEYELTVRAVDGDRLTLNFISDAVWFDAKYFTHVKKTRVFTVGETVTEKEFRELPDKSVVVSDSSGSPYIINRDGVVPVITSPSGSTVEINTLTGGYITYTLVHVGEKNA